MEMMHALAVLAVVGVAMAVACETGTCNAVNSSTGPNLMQLTRHVGSKSINVQDDSGTGGTNVCYFTNWARYRRGLINEGKDVFEMGLDPLLCSHFVYGFATVKRGADGSYFLESNDPNADHPSGHQGQDGLCAEACNDRSFKPDWSQPNGQRCDWPCNPTRTLRGYEGLTVGMKRQNPSIKGLISVGGWNFNDCAASASATHGQGSATCEIFSTIAASEHSIRAFAANIIAFCRKWGFDGFDLDWEYPVVAGHNSNQKPFQDVHRDYENFITMLRLLKEEFLKENPREPLLLMAAVGVGKSTVDTAYSIPAMSQHLDLINLMTYDLHGAWESRTGCNANLYATAEDVKFGGGVGAGEAVEGYPLSVSWAVEYWIGKGALPSKLTLGLGTYGRGWKLADPAQSGYNAPASGACSPGVSTKSAGYMSYYEILELISSGGATRHYDNERQCPYIVTTGGEWIGYDDAQSIGAKLDYARKQGLAGTMVWALDLDDFAGAYSNGKKYPLINLAAASGPEMPAPSVPTPTPAMPTPAPAVPTPAPAMPTPVPAVPTQAPAMPTPAPPMPTPAQAVPTSAPPVPTPAPVTPAPAPAVPTPTPALPTPAPSAPAPAMPRPSPPPASQKKACVQNLDCGSNPWCKDASYEAWCGYHSSSGCPTPQCKASEAEPAKPHPAQPITQKPLPSRDLQCVQNLDCGKNPWCRDTSYRKWCSYHRGECPSPQCVLPGSSAAPTAGPITKPTTAPTAAPATTVAPTTPVATAPQTTAAASTTVTAATTVAPGTTGAASTTAAPPVTNVPTTSTLPRTTVSTDPGSVSAALRAVLAALQASKSEGVFMYDTGRGWQPSDVYTWPDMTEAVRLMATTGVGSAKLWLGDRAEDFKYGLVNVAAFLAQCMQETIQYNACDENNWSDKAVVAEAGGSTYSSTAACGQLHQSYQDYQCSAEEDAQAGGQMACEVDPDMEMRANTQATWYGAPAKLFCAPRSKIPKAPRWDYSAPWCAPPGGWGHVAPFSADVPMDEYLDYVKSGGSCKDYDGIKTGGWTFDGEGCVDGACAGSPAPLFGQPEGRTDVEGCCWWGRGVIQTTGTCNFGKLNYYIGQRAAREGRGSLYPDVDFCKNPGAICEPGGPPELKWVAGLFYWLNAVQPYSAGGWKYREELMRWVDAGMDFNDKSFINGASGIVNRGCHNPPNCGTGELHGGENRVKNFRKVLDAMGLV